MLQEYSGKEYLGENCLHIAIVNGDLESVRMLLERSQALADASRGTAAGSAPNPLLASRAVGSFFSAARFLESGQGCYYGELPLLFAACTNQPELVRYLVQEWGADLDCTDSHGNTALHFMVLHDQPDMYDFICDLWQERHGSPSCPLQGRLNKAGLTPLTLAASLGFRRMFQHVLQRHTASQWRYGPVDCLQVPLEELDPVGWILRNRVALAAGTLAITDRPLSALEVIMQQQQLALLEHPRVKRLLSKKWETFGQRVFYSRLRFYCAFMCLFTATVVLRSLLPSRTPWLVRDWAQCSAQGQGPLCAISAVGDACILLVALVKGWREVQEIRGRPGGWAEHWASSGAAFLDNALSAVFSTSVLTAATLSQWGGVSPLAGHLAQAATAAASVAAWAYALWFLLGFQLTGPFVIMIAEMMASDMIKFLCLLFVFQMGFAQASFVLMDKVGSGQFVQEVRSAFEAMLGNFVFHVEGPVGSANPTVANLLLLIYVVVASVLLINLFVAMMSSTYDKVLAAAEQAWSLERARIISAVESEMSYEARLRQENKFWAEIDGQAFLQVMHVDDGYFSKEAASARAAAKAELYGRQLRSARERLTSTPPQAGEPEAEGGPTSLEPASPPKRARSAGRQGAPTPALRRSPRRRSTRRSG